jgi:4-amino-4-deoxy-L-arabinose transferase-like glycosyltransferase
VWYAYRILKLFRLQPEWNALGLSLLMVLPLLFFSTYGFESDVLLGAIMIALLYYALRYGFRERVPNCWTAIRLGALAGLAAATKYSGLIGVVFMMLVIGKHTLRHFRSAAAWRNVMLAAAICATIGSWKYVDNLERYGTPMYAGNCVGCTQSYSSGLYGLSQVKSPNPIKPYDFSTFHLRSLISVLNDDSFSGRLTDWWAYRSFWTTMYGLTWNDPGMFSIRSDTETRPRRTRQNTSPRSLWPRSWCSALCQLC